MLTDGTQYFPTVGVMETQYQSYGITILTYIGTSNRILQIYNMQSKHNITLLTGIQTEVMV